MNYLLVDEYQDSRYAQQQNLFRLAAVHRNICVFGDEDQLIYRFHGGNPQGIGAFLVSTSPMPTSGKLTSNYRPPPRIHLSLPATSVDILIRPEGISLRSTHR